MPCDHQRDTGAVAVFAKLQAERISGRADTCATFELEHYKPVFRFNIHSKLHALFQRSSVSSGPNAHKVWQCPVILMKLVRPK